jgi:hypothetical protein
MRCWLGTNRKVFRPQSNASHTTMAKRPARASAISDAVMSAPPRQEINMRHDRLSDHFGREPLSPCYGGRVRPWTLPRPRTGTFARAGKTQDQVRTAARFATLLAALHGRMRRHDVRPPSDSGKCKLKKPATGFPVRAFDFCDGDNMQVICPTCQISGRSAPPRRMNLRALYSATASSILPELKNFASSTRTSACSSSSSSGPGADWFG